jgi:hypothetical protein
MARPKGSKSVPCTKPRCKGQVIGLVGTSGVCAKCGTKIRITKKLLKELGKL